MSAQTTNTDAQKPDYINNKAKASTSGPLYSISKAGREKFIQEEIEEKERPVDPKEPRFCKCRKNAHGTMIGCDYNVRLSGILSFGNFLLRRSYMSRDWYCPTCRVKTGKGVFSNGVVGGPHDDA
ncbi:hypothetical protein AUEXF2481DRAFT_43180 [Aureobasidium subglaciale EXF-2481]|uniref:Uncharacterized protein n=1 Tax=Aureobasidium subglaciale (strain EXF-2481) TaxID=1043005 RepID=A0A074Y3M2_AURSE|nr:uncharacterized protein AUEXF2481DRAFT_43180 [Aureobasidium subglaciale EXF-2481]KEQ92393.1 hypothetical protein AUEXF2481DRAFT_43180 [Aureobasidium subglaciale EXF-2481]